jgi:putative DNA primase/helicase
METHHPAPDSAVPMPVVTGMDTDAHTPNQQEEAQTPMTLAAYFEVTTPCTSHPQLTKWGVQMRDVADTLQGLQAIAPDGQTEFFPPGIAKGCCHLIDGTSDAVLVCESHAVGASLHEATGYAVAVAFHADNLEAVALALKAEFPDVPSSLPLTTTTKTPGQPSLTAANTAAQVVGCPVAVPDFGTNKESHLTNFNHLHQLSGREAVKRCIDAVLPALPANPAAGAPAASTGQVQGTALRNAPVPDPACLYGLVGDIALVGSQNTEANPYAVAASAIAYLGAAMGRGPYFPIGDDLHHARLFLLHVGRSGLGRKGTAKKLVKRIHDVH